MDPSPPPVFVVPGMKVGCMPYDAMIISTLECFFSQSCLNATAKWISNLPPAQWPKALNSSTMSTFTPYTPAKSLIDKQMVDRWIRVTDFEGYYTSCAPIQCTYTVEQYNSFAYVISLLISLYGGLTVALRFMAPYIVKFGRGIHKFLKTCKQSRDRFNGEDCGIHTANSIILLYPFSAVTSAQVENDQVSHASTIEVEQACESSVQASPESDSSHLTLLQIRIILAYRLAKQADTTYVDRQNTCTCIESVLSTSLSS